MPIDEVTISRRCSNCGTEIEVVSVKKDNMMLSSKELVACPKCQAEHPEVRNIVGRLESIKTEQASYPPSVTIAPDRSTAER